MNRGYPDYVTILFKFITVLFLVVGLLMGLVGVAFMVKTAVFVATSEVTVGRIERLKARQGRSVNYIPIYSFTDRAGVTHRNVGILSGRAPWKAGQPVPVRYTPTDAAISAINTFHDLWMVPVGFLLFCVAYVAVMIWHYRKLSEGGPARRERSFVTRVSSSGGNRYGSQRAGG